MWYESVYALFKSRKNVTLSREAILERVVLNLLNEIRFCTLPRCCCKGKENLIPIKNGQQLVERYVQKIET